MSEMTSPVGADLSKAYIGLGSNLGDRVQNLIDARQQLQNLPACHAIRRSSLYLSSPVGDETQADFINCVLELDFADGVDSLFAAMQNIESIMGRQRDPDNRNAARVIDIDLLLFGDFCSDDAALIVPHPRMAQRLFVLEPLCELDPMLAIPSFGISRLSETIRQGRKQGVFGDQKIYKLGS